MIPSLNEETKRSQKGDSPYFRINFQAKTEKFPVGNVWESEGVGEYKESLGNQ